MAERLSRERIAELRRFVEVGLDVAASQGMCVTADKWRDILAALDAYEAQRPRPGIVIAQAELTAEEFAESKIYLQVDSPRGRTTRDVVVLVPPAPEDSRCL